MFSLEQIAFITLLNHRHNLGSQYIIRAIKAVLGKVSPILIKHMLHFLMCCKRLEVSTICNQHVIEIMVSLNLGNFQILRLSNPQDTVHQPTLMVAPSKSYAAPPAQSHHSQGDQEQRLEYGQCLTPPKNRPPQNTKHLMNSHQVKMPTSAGIKSLHVCVNLVL